MRFFYSAIFCGFISFALVANGESIGPYLGFVEGTESSPEYFLTFNFGVDQWENGIRSEKLFEQWHLNCSYPDSLTKKLITFCSLDRDKFLIFEGEAILNRQESNSIDGTLRLINVDWERGVLDFTFVHKDKTTTSVQIRFARRGKSIYLRSFKALAVARGVFSDTFTTIEYRIPEYTYTRNIPMKMRGIKSELDKNRDDLISSLSQADQEAWKNFKSTVPNKCELFEENRNQNEDQIMRQIIPNWEERKAEIEKKGNLTPDETNWLKKYLYGKMTECFASSNISSEGQKKILKVIMDTLGEK